MFFNDVLFSDKHQIENSLQVPYLAVDDSDVNEVFYQNMTLYDFDLEVC